MKAVLNYRVDKPLTDVIFKVQFYSQEGRLCSFFSSETLGGRLMSSRVRDRLVLIARQWAWPRCLFHRHGNQKRLAPYGVDIDLPASLSRCV